MSLVNDHSESSQAAPPSPLPTGQTMTAASPMATQAAARDPTNSSQAHMLSLDLPFHSQYTALDPNMAQQANQQSQPGQPRTAFSQQASPPYHGRSLNMGYMVNALPQNFHNPYAIASPPNLQGLYPFDPQQVPRHGSQNSMFSGQQQGSGAVRLFPRTTDPRINNPGAYFPYPNPDPQVYGHFQPPSVNTVNQSPAHFIESGEGHVIQHAPPSFRGAQPAALDVAIKSPHVVPRGPPRKPRQSGHALWVGNLPLGATITDLKDHFSRDATDDIESLKLISKSSCAFVNYRTAAACQAAMNRFHDSRFHGTRLVCRLRRPSNVSPTTPTSPTKAQPAEEAEAQVPPQHVPVPQFGSQAESVQREHEKFFVLKSLTVHDLEMSTRNGIWATQAHNESMLNEAYKSSDNVYLVFSANKSGEYFGYARMASAIPAPDLPEQPEPASPAPAETPYPVPKLYQLQAGPKVIPTSSTEWAPRGHIIDDSARGTIFWEADVEEHVLQSSPSRTPEEGARTPSNTGVGSGGTHENISSPREPIIASSDLPSAAEMHEEGISSLRPSWDEDTDAPGYGRSFRVTWISINRVPFHRTRGLRNPRNANREVKIARDGTELDREVGRKLISLFGTKTGSEQLQGPLIVGGGGMS